MKKLFFLLAVLLSFSRFSAAKIHSVYMNYTNELNNTEKTKIFNLWKQYLTQKENVDTLWDEIDVKKFKGIDLLKDGVGLGGSLYKISFDCSVISISEMGENYLIRSALYFTDVDSLIKNRNELFAIIDVIAVKRGTNYKLSNYINYATASWNQKTVGKIIYHYPQAYPFDIYKAKSANTFLDSLQSWFACPVDTINYYIPLNCTDGYKMVGYEFFEGEGRELNLCGFYDSKNNIIYSNAIEGECHKHELVHQINKLFPHANSYLLAGLAAYLDDAGSFGKPEKFHLKRYLEYLKMHPADFNKFYDINYIDEITSPVYIFGAVICNAILKKGGLGLLKEALASGRKDEELVEFLKRTFNINDLNVFFNKEFKVYMNQSDVLLRTEKN